MLGDAWCVAFVMREIWVVMWAGGSALGPRRHARSTAQLVWAYLFVCVTEQYWRYARAFLPFRVESSVIGVWVSVWTRAYSRIMS
jgi:hypothetical protein